MLDFPSIKYAIDTLRCTETTGHYFYVQACPTTQAWLSRDSKRAMLRLDGRHTCAQLVRVAVRHAAVRHRPLAPALIHHGDRHLRAAACAQRTPVSSNSGLADDTNIMEQTSQHILAGAPPASQAWPPRMAPSSHRVARALPYGRVQVISPLLILIPVNPHAKYQRFCDNLCYAKPKVCLCVASQAGAPVCADTGTAGSR